jgi:hypothetical protein
LVGNPELDRGVLAHQVYDRVVLYELDMVLRCNSAMSRTKKHPSITEFLNVDLDIYAHYDLQPLVTARGRKVKVLYAGRERRSYSAHLELARITKFADSTIRGFCSVIRALPRPERKSWDRARRRDFSVGFQAGEQPNSSDFVIQASTVQAAADLAGRIVLTLYGGK